MSLVTNQTRFKGIETRTTNSQALCLMCYKPDPIQGDWDYTLSFNLLNSNLLQTRPDSRGLRQATELFYRGWTQVTNQTRFKGIETLNASLASLLKLSCYKPDPIQGDWDAILSIILFIYSVTNQTRFKGIETIQVNSPLISFSTSYKPDPIQGDWDAVKVRPYLLIITCYKPDPIQGDWDVREKTFYAFTIAVTNQTRFKGIETR